MENNEALSALLDAVQTTIDDATWFPDHSVGTEEMLIPSATIAELSRAYRALTEDPQDE